MGCDVRSYYETVIKKNIEFDYIAKYKIGKKDDTESILGIMADICSLPDDATVKSKTATNYRFHQFVKGSCRSIKCIWNTLWIPWKRIHRMSETSEPT